MREQLLNEIDTELRRQHLSINMRIALQETKQFVESVATISPQGFDFISQLIHNLQKSNDRALSTVEQIYQQCDDAIVKNLLKFIRKEISHRLRLSLLNTNFTEAGKTSKHQEHLIKAHTTAIQAAHDDGDREREDALRENLELIKTTEMNNNVYDHNATLDFMQQAVYAREGDERRCVFALDTGHGDHAICIGTKNTPQSIKISIYNSGYGTEYHTKINNGKRSSAQIFDTNRVGLLTAVERAKARIQKAETKQSIDLVHFTYQTAQNACTGKSRPGKSFYAGQSMGNCSAKVWNRISQEHLKKKEYLKVSIAILKEEKEIIRSNFTEVLLADNQVQKSRKDETEWEVNATSSSDVLAITERAILIAIDLKIMYREGKLAVLRHDQDGIQLIESDISARQEELKQRWAQLKSHQKLQQKLTRYVEKNYLHKLRQYQASHSQSSQHRAETMTGGGGDVGEKQSTSQNKKVKAVKVYARPVPAHEKKDANAVIINPKNVRVVSAQKNTNSHAFFRPKPQMNSQAVGNTHQEKAQDPDQAQEQEQRPKPKTGPTPSRNG